MKCCQMETGHAHKGGVVVSVVNGRVSNSFRHLGVVPVIGPVSHRVHPQAHRHFGNVKRRHSGVNRQTQQHSIGSRGSIT